MDWHALMTGAVSLESIEFKLHTLLILLTKLCVPLQLLEEFTDVNSGEKAFFKLWNRFTIALQRYRPYDAHQCCR